MNAPNPFTPPEAELADPPDHTPGSPVKAVLLGFLADFGGTMLASIPLGFLYGVFLAMSGVGADEIANAMTDVPVDSGYSLLSFAVGLGFSALGGYVCARIAKRSEHVLAAVMATLSALCGLFIIPDNYSNELIALLTIASYAAAIGGGELGRRRNQRG
jgi:hypothetical protein